MKLFHWLRNIFPHQKEQRVMCKTLTEAVAKPGQIIPLSEKDCESLQRSIERYVLLSEAGELNKKESQIKELFGLEVINRPPK